jgi:prepilin-type N-terminal cleavage/methylation domain-containing protein|tara:strand:+ start:694 stop:1371 length:678 start_codon:yes stop_codon:yes gene_type:complete
MRRDAPVLCRTGGFSLIEMILVISLLALILPMVLGFVFNLSQIWLKGAKGNFFAQHVDGVSLFLDTALERSEAIVGDGAEGETTLPIEWARPPGFSDFDDPLLMFRQRETPALFVREGESLPNIFVYIYHDDREGLSLVWYSSHQEEVEDEDDLYRTPISKYVSKIQYAYYDAENDEWDVEDDPEEGDNDAYILPQYLKLTFAYEDEEFVRNLHIPQRSTDVPLF